MESINTGVEFYSNVKASEVEWVWYPYIPCGKITMLQGDPGEGKSTLIIHIAATLTKGGYLPDGQKIKKPEMVIYQCSEDGKGDFSHNNLKEQRYNMFKRNEVKAYDVSVYDTGR